tara:strand:- start:234 stop:2006 length:1773 start_codon:yes stop_codon:yes gene_type:complete
MATGLENPFLKSIGLSDTFESLRDRFTNTEAVDAAGRGEYLRALGRAGGDILGAAGDVIAAPVNMVFEMTGINDGIKALVQKGLDTDTGKQLLTLAEENPKYAKDITNLLDIVSVVPASKLTKEIINDVFHNMKTKVEGGFVGDAVQKARTKLAESQGKDAPEKPNFYNSPQAPLVAGEALNSLISSVNDRFNPFQRATTRASGIPTGKRKEIESILNRGETNNAIAEAATARMMQGQRYGEVPAMFGKGSPLDRYTYAATDIPSTDLNRIAEVIGGRDIPDSVVSRQLNDFNQSQLLPEKSLTGFLAGMFNKPSQGTMVDVYNPNTRNAGSEYANQPMNQAPGAALHKMFKEDRISKLPEGTSPFELMKAAKTADYLNGQQGVVERVRKGPRLNIGGKVEAATYILKALDKQKQGKKLTEKETKALSQYEKTKLNAADELGFQHGASSHVSALKEIGGTRDVSSLQGMDRLFSSMSDKNDIFGLNFLNPKQDRASIFPIQQRNLGDSRATTDARLERFLTKDDVDSFAKTADIEKLSGVPKKKGEKATNYQLRAIAEMRKNPELRDYAEVLQNALLTAYVGSSNTQMEE